MIFINIIRIKKQKLKELSAKYPNYVTNGIEGAKFNEEYTE